MIRIKTIKYIERLANNKFIRGGAILTITSFIVNLCSYFFYIVSARAAGPKGYGEIVTLFSFVTILSIPINIVSAVIVRRLGIAGKNREIVAAGFESWFLAKLRKWWVLSILFLIIPLVLPNFANIQITTSITLVVLLIFGFIDAIYFALLQGIRSFGYYSLALIMSVLLKLAGAILFFVGLGNLTTVYAGIVLGAFISTIPAVYRIHKINTWDLKVKYSLEKSLANLLLNKSTIITFVSLLGITLLGNIDIILAKKLFSSVDSGLYGAWSLFAKTVLYFLGPLSTILFVYFSSLDTKKNHKIVMINLFILSAILGVIICGLYYFLGHTLVSIILSKSFSGIENYLPLAGVFGISYTLITIVNGYFVASKNNYSLIGIISIPFYIIALLMLGSTIYSFITINVVYSILLAICYSALYAYGHIARS